MTETPEMIIVLYSKYSSQCQRIINYYHPSLTFIHFICIDNMDIRKQLAKTSLKIKSVPCAVLVYNNGKKEKFEGPNVADWVIEQINNNKEHIVDIENSGNSNIQDNIEATDFSNIQEGNLNNQTPVVGQTSIMDLENSSNEPMIVRKSNSIKEQVERMQNERESLLKKNTGAPQQM